MHLDTALYDISALTLLGVVLLTGFYAGRLARRVNLPSLVGYMLLGIVIGPSGFNLFHANALEELSFLAEIGLGFVALTIGTELSLVSLRRLGWAIAAIILGECGLAFAAVLVGVYLFSGDLPLALLMAAMAPATAPAGTVAVIQECRASGSLTKTIYAVAGFDDGVAVIIYGFAAALAKWLLVDHPGRATTLAGVGEALGPAGLEIGASLLLGVAFGLLFCRMVRRLRQPGEILVIIVGTVLLTTGIAVHFHLSLIIANMTVGFLLVNSRGETLVQRVRGPLLEVMPMIFILFFCLAGAHLHIKALPGLGLLGLVYISCRMVGKVSGASLGAALGRAEEKIRRYLGWSILSQAGVAIGLALIANNDLLIVAERYQVPHAAAIGATVLATITTTSVVFEVVGPLATRAMLKRAGEVPAEVEADESTEEG